ncbi:MAG: hypothetical protein H7256_00100 [Bdellovibrio sp.]|nr:hypothetical protein [Bdellovibrio sp.]
MMLKKILAASLCAGFLLTSSCLKKQDLSDDKLGAAVAPIEMTKAIGSGYGSYDYNDIKAGEFTSIRYWNRIQDSVVQNVSQQGIEVTRAANTVDKLSLDLLVQTEIFASGGQSSQSSTVQWTGIDINKPSGLMAQTQSLHAKASDLATPNLLFLSFEALAFGICHDEGQYPETCHNLQKTDIQYPVPIAAIAQHNCADASNCTIPAKRIEFDRILKTVLDKDGKPKRVHYTITLSPRAPFLSRMLEYCTRALYDITNSDQKLLADVCYTVNNYKFAP